MILQFIVWSLLLYGISNILVYGSILNWFRDWVEKIGNKKYPIISPTFHFVREMLRCMMCTPFHVGYILSFALYSPIAEIFSIQVQYSWIFDAFLASGVVWMINSIVEWYEQNRPQNK